MHNGDDISQWVFSILDALSLLLDDPRTLLPVQRALLTTAGNSKPIEASAQWLKNELHNVDMDLGSEWGGFSNLMSSIFEGRNGLEDMAKQIRTSVSDIAAVCIVLNGLRYLAQFSDRAIVAWLRMRGCSDEIVHAFKHHPIIVQPKLIPID